MRIIHDRDGIMLETEDEWDACRMGVIATKLKRPVTERAGTSKGDKKILRLFLSINEIFKLTEIFADK